MFKLNAASRKLAPAALAASGLAWLWAVPQTPAVYDQYRIWGRAIQDIADGQWLHASGSSVSGVGRLGPLGRWLVQVPLAAHADEWTLPFLTTLLAWATMLLAWRRLQQRMDGGTALLAVLAVATQPTVWIWSRFGFDFAFLPMALWLLWMAFARARDRRDAWTAGILPGMAAAAAMQIHSTAWPVAAVLIAELGIRRPRAGVLTAALASPLVVALAAGDGQSPWGSLGETLRTSMSLLRPLAGLWQSGAGLPIDPALTWIGWLVLGLGLGGILHRPTRRAAAVLWASLAALGFPEEAHYHHMAHLAVGAAFATIVAVGMLAGGRWRLVLVAITAVQVATVMIADDRAAKTGHWNFNIYALRPDLDPSKIPTLAAHRRLVDRLHAERLTSAAERSPRLIGQDAWIHLDPGLVRLADVAPSKAAPPNPGTVPADLGFELGSCDDGETPIYGRKCLRKRPVPSISLQADGEVLDLWAARLAAWQSSAARAAFPPRPPIDLPRPTLLTVRAPAGWAVVPVWIHFPDLRIPRPVEVPTPAARSHMFSMGAATTGPIEWGWPLVDLAPVSLACRESTWDDDQGGDSPCVSP